MPRSAGRSRHLPPRWLIATGAAIVGLGIGIGLWTTGASAVSGYRTGTATTASVSKTLNVTGTASAVHQATSDFQVAGTVAAVDVSLGQQVTSGQTLASLKTTTLEKDVSSAQTTLTAAEARLSEDETSQSSSSSASSDTGSAGATTATTTTTTTTSPPTPSGSGPSNSTATLTKAQQAVVTAQQTADSDTTIAEAALKEAQTACSTSSTGTAPSTTPSTKPSTKPTTTPPASTTTATGSSTSTSGSSTSAACLSALAKAQSAQQQVQTDQAALAKAETALAKLLSSSSTSSSSSGAGTGSGASGSASNPTSSGGSTPSGSGTTSSSGTSTQSSSGSNPTGGSSATAGSTATGGSSTASDSAEQLASDQASIDSAEASLIKAQQNLADAQLTTPISGTVAAVNLAAGQSVSAGSATDAITIVNSGSFQATATLTPTQANEVKVGDAAQVTVTGTTGTLDGTVARVGPVDTSSSSYTYPLVVALPAGSHGIASGSAAQITITLAEAKDTEVVPTSAVHRSDAGSYVDVIKGDQAVRQVVQVGVVGAEYTQITSGLTPNAEVVLADLSQAVPSSSSTSSSSSRLLGGGGGGFPGAGRSFPGGAIRISIGG